MLLISIGKSSNISISSNQDSVYAEINQEVIEVNYQKVRIDFRSIDEIHVVEELEIKNLENDSISEMEFWPSLNLDFRNILVTDEGYSPITSVPHEITKSITIYFDQVINTNQSFTFIVDYYLDISLDPSGHKPPYYYNFQYFPVLTYFTHEYNVELGLPTNSWLHEDEIIQQSFFPINGTYDPSGGRIFIYWSFINVNPETYFFIEVYFDEPGDPSNPLWLYIVGPLFGIALGAFSVYWWMKKKETKVMKEVGKVFLTEDQKLILNLIIESEGKITQKELINRTGFTKSKISRNLTPLENNELISKERWGREYKVFITDRGRKVIE